MGIDLGLPAMLNGHEPRRTASRPPVAAHTDIGAAARRDGGRSGPVRAVSRDRGVILLAPGKRISEVVEHLVAARHPVHEIATEEQTLERFYLELMR